MQISAISTAYGGGQAQRLLAQLLQSQTAAAGQDLPGETAAASAPGGPPPGPPPSGAGGGGGFAADTLSGLLSTQEAASPADGMAAKVIDAADTDGDGMLSLEEIQAALGGGAADQTDALSGAIAKLDSDGDSKLSADELSAGIKTRHAHGGHRPQPPTSADLAAQMIGDVDANGDGSLSAEEVQTAFAGDTTATPDSADGFASAFGKLDTDSDGQLTAAELSAALDAFRAAQAAGYAA
ncbi:MAG: hypothetical protein JWP92_2491, partial [Caulobacter sp.]|nr:hypothetical protein [Caulobacter sp.]